MRLVKIFKTIESELWTMEKEINSWIKESGAHVINITGNIAPQTGSSVGQGFSASDILLIVTYEPSESADS